MIAQTLVQVNLIAQVPKIVPLDHKCDQDLCRLQGMSQSGIEGLDRTTSRAF